MSQVLVFHFTASFSGSLQRRFYNLFEHLQGSFFAEIQGSYFEGLLEILSLLLSQVYKLSRENTQQENIRNIVFEKKKVMMGQ